MYRYYDNVFFKLVFKGVVDVKVRRIIRGKIVELVIIEICCFEVMFECMLLL